MWCRQAAHVLSHVAARPDAYRLGLLGDEQAGGHEEEGPAVADTLDCLSSHQRFAGTWVRTVECEQSSFKHSYKRPSRFFSQDMI